MALPACGYSARAPAPPPPAAPLPLSGLAAPEAGTYFTRGAGALRFGSCAPRGRSRSHLLASRARCVCASWPARKCSSPRARAPSGWQTKRQGRRGAERAGRGPRQGARRPARPKQGPPRAPLGRRRAAQGPPPWRGPLAAAGPTEARNQHKHIEGRGSFCQNAERSGAPAGGARLIHLRSPNLFGKDQRAFPNRF